MKGLAPEHYGISLKEVMSRGPKGLLGLKEPRQWGQDSVPPSVCIDPRRMGTPWRAAVVQPTHTTRALL